MDFINHIRYLLFGTSNRKRRAIDDFENPVTNKIRRISTSQMSNPEDDWASITSSNNSLRRRSGILPRRVISRNRPSWLKDNNPITVDDDDEDIIEMKKPVEFEFMRKSSLKHTSTPNCSASKSPQNGDDDVTFVKYTSPDEKKALAKKRGFDYIKPGVNFSNCNASPPNNRFTNGTKKKEANATSRCCSKEPHGKFVPLSKKTPNQTSAIDHSFRLDEKRKYRELLSKAAPQSSMRSILNSFVEYSTPMTKIFGFGSSRGKKIADMALKSNDKKMNNFVDLTNNGKDAKQSGLVDLTAIEKPKQRRYNTCATIKKVLSEMDNDVVVKDSDSEVEILPTPPSPKPDFPVEKCNSLKTFVHPSQPTHEDWLKNEIKKHDEVIERTQRLIEEQSLNIKKFNSINDELRLKLLGERVSDCLHIKELLISDEPRRFSFPELSPKEEALVSNALDHKQPASEILSSKFNMNITRQDILTLSGLNWLNDEVINFYMNLIIERGKIDIFPKAYAMNTFFYPKILSGGQSSVKRWTRKVDIFSYDVIAVPIHLRMHWCMAIIDFRKKKITYYDSMGSSNMQCLKALLSYLKDEHLDKKKTEYDTSDWLLINAKDIPQQMNGSDCGVFSCTFAEVLTRDGDLNFGQENMPYLRRKMVLEILEGRLLFS